jgi:hypothetical protein
MTKITCPKGFEISVLQTNHFYIGTFSEEEGPYCRLSEEYYLTRELAQEALDNFTFTERDCMENNFCRENCNSCVAKYRKLD